MNRTKLLEELALLEHEQWSAWIEHMDKIGIHGTTTIEFELHAWNERCRKASLPYGLLSEAEKEKDRKFARKVLKKLKELKTYGC